MLHHFRTALPGIDITVVRNLYFGNADKFVWLEKFNEQAESKVQVINLPDLNDNVADVIYDKSLALDACKALKYGERIEIDQFRNACERQFDKIEFPE